MVPERGRVRLLPQLLQELRGALDVREQEGDRSRGELAAHAEEVTTPRDVVECGA
jgi:hypothetical protein